MKLAAPNLIKLQETLKREATEMSDPLIHQRRDKTKVKRTLDAIRKEEVKP